MKGFKKGHSSNPDNKEGRRCTGMLEALSEGVFWSGRMGGGEMVGGQPGSTEQHISAETDC